MMSVTTEGMAQGEKRSFKDKMKFFEQEIEEQKNVKPKSGGRKFSYLSEHEVQNIRKEEERKMSLMSQDELMKQFKSAHGDDPAFDMVMKSDSKAPVNPAGNPTKPETSPEHRHHNSTNGNSTSLSTSLTGSLTGSLDAGSSTRRKPVESHMSTLERRAREEERRSAIRAARMRSLEADANRAQAVIARSRQAQQQQPQQQQQQQQFTDSQHRPNSSAENDVETTRQQILELEVNDDHP